jgi:hypothetical protein
MIISLLFIGGTSIFLEKVIHSKTGDVIEYPEIDQSILACLLTVLLSLMPLILTIGLHPGSYINPSYIALIATMIFIGFRMIRKALL